MDVRYCGTSGSTKSSDVWNCGCFLIWFPFPFVQGHVVVYFLLKQDRAIIWIKAAFENAMQFPINCAALFGSLTPKLSHCIAIPMAFLTGKDSTESLGLQQGWLKHIVTNGDPPINLNVWNCYNTQLTMITNSTLLMVLVMVANHFTVTDPPKGSSNPK